MEKKNYDEEGKEMKKDRKRREKSVTQTWLDLNSVPLGCEDALAGVKILHLHEN